MRQVVNLRGRRLPSIRQWQELPRFLTAQERFLARAALSLAIISGIALTGHLWLSTRVTTPAVGGSYIEGALGTPQYINPLYAAGSDVESDLTRLVYSGLLRYDGEQGLVPDLAEQFTISEDQKTYTFTLKSGVTWHDGEPLTANDVVFTIAAIQNPEYHSPLAVSFTGMQVTAPDEHTVIFTLDEPFAPFLAALTVGILPAHLWEEVSPQSAPLAPMNIKPVGTGPYMFSKLVKDNRGTLRSMTLTRNPHFYRGTVYLDEITMKFYADLRELTDAVRNKNVEGASVLAAQDAQALADDGVVTLGAPRLSQFTAIFFNQKHSTILADDAVRQALNQATDRVLVAQVATGTYGSPIISPLLPGMAGYTPDTTVPTPDTESAKALLESKNWTFAQGATVRSNGATPLSFTITTLDSPDLIAAAQELERQWEAIGASVDVAVIDEYTLQTDSIKNHNYDALLAGERYGAYPDLYPFWHSSQTVYPGLNLGGFANRKVDTAIETARTSTDPAKTIEANQLFAASFAEEIPAIMLYQPSYLYGVSPKLSNTTVAAVTTPSDRFTNVEQWYRKTKWW
jgi:peptide/nickel transport system substrate-binding protein